jgi:hypothetical protein
MKSVLLRLDKELVPLGFVRQQRTWNRRRKQFVDVIDIQRSKFSATVTLNIGVLDDQAYFVCWGCNPEPFVDEANCTARARIGDLLDGRDKWWDIDGQNAADELVDCIKNQALPFFEHMHSPDKMCDRLMITSRSGKFPPDCVYLAALQQRLGNESQAYLILTNLEKSKGAWSKGIEEIAIRMECKEFVSLKNPQQIVDGKRESTSLDK